MINKKRRLERARTAPSHKPQIVERKSFAQDAKQTLRNMSLINDMQHAQDNKYEWTKQEDNLSITSFEYKEQKTLNSHQDTKNRPKQKTYHYCTRHSSPLLPNNSKLQQKRSSKTYKTQLIPSSVDLNSYFVKQRIHLSQRQSLANNKMRLFNSIIFRKTHPIIKSFKSLSNQKQKDSLKTNKQPIYFNLNIKNNCKQIVPLKINFSKGVDNGEDRHNKILHSLADERLKQNKANIVRKLLKDQRNSNFNESLFNKGELQPQF